jgi:hypothetical protein
VPCTTHSDFTQQNQEPRKINPDLHNRLLVERPQPELETPEPELETPEPELEIPKPELETSKPELEANIFAE